MDHLHWIRLLLETLRIVRRMALDIVEDRPDCLQLFDSNFADEELALLVGNLVAADTVAVDIIVAEVDILEVMPVATLEAEEGIAHRLTSEDNSFVVVAVVDDTDIAAEVDTLVTKSEKSSVVIHCWL